jgi:hypothetical protein
MSAWPFLHTQWIARKRARCPTCQPPMRSAGDTVWYWRRRLETLYRRYRRRFPSRDRRTGLSRVTLVDMSSIPPGRFAARSIQMIQCRLR